MTETQAEQVAETAAQTAEQARKLAEPNFGVLSADAVVGH